MAVANIITRQKSVQAIPPLARKVRRPQHSFQIRHPAWAITPFMAAPVLPGDTLNNLMLQARAVSDPVKHPLIGWWIEYYFYYVPHRAMLGSAQFQAMMLDPTLDVTSGNRDASTRKEVYNFAGGANFVDQATLAVVKYHFRDEGEVSNADWFTGYGGAAPAGSDGQFYKAQIGLTNLLQSAMLKSTFDASEAVDVDVEGPDANTTIQASEVEKAMRTYEMLRENRLTNQTYEEFLRTYGVRVPDREKEYLPELLRYVREWTYPSNTIDPATGTPSSALSWSIMERADKSRFFKEPGVLLGLSVARPKLYMSKQTGAGIGMLDNMFGWLPAVLGDDPYSSLKAITGGTGPLAGAASADYILDVKDLYTYGDQWVNFPLTDTNAGLVALPTATMQKKYASAADGTGLFKTPGTNGVTALIRQDGLVTLDIKSSVVDTTDKT